MQHVQNKTQASPSLTPSMDLCLINPKGRKSVEYAKGRKAIDADYQHIFAFNQALAKKTRKEAKRRLIKLLDGNVSRNEKNVLIVSFNDGSVANM